MKIKLLVVSGTQCSNVRMPLVLTSDPRLSCYSQAKVFLLKQFTFTLMHFSHGKKNPLKPTEIMSLL